MYVEGVYYCDECGKEIDTGRVYILEGKDICENCIAIYIEERAVFIDD